MEKILQFIKTYKVWILIGIVLAIVVTLILYNLIANRNNNKDIQKIVNPYFTQTFDLEIDLRKTTDDNIPSKDKVFKVVGNINDNFTSFLNNFHSYSERIDFSKEIYLILGKDTFSYSPKTRILMVNSQQGLTLWFKITSESEVSSFFQEYFNIERINLVSRPKTVGKNIEYRGNFVFKDTDIGSVYMDGNAFTLEVNSKGDIVKLSMLLLNESNIVEYQLMPLSDIETLIEDTRYPKMIIYTEIEERYYDLPPLIATSAVLTDFVTTELSGEYIFTDSNIGFVLPTYRLVGDGRLKDSKGEKYLAKVNIFICAVSPTYLVERELEKGENFSDPVSPESL